MTFVFDAPNADRLGDNFQESRVEARDGKFFHDDEFDPGDFTPIIMMITNNIAQGLDPRSVGYQVPENLAADLEALKNVVEIFTARTPEDWARVGKIRPNIRVLVLQPEYMGLSGSAADGRQISLESLTYSGGLSMLPLIPAIGGFPIIYRTETITQMSVAGFENFDSLVGPGRPGSGLQAGYNVLSRHGRDKLQPRYTQDQLDFLGINQQFTVITDIGRGLRDENRSLLEPEGGVGNQIPIFPGLYWNDLNLTDGRWLADWILGRFGTALPNTIVFKPSTGSRMRNLEHSIRQQNPRVSEGGIDRLAIHHNIFPSEWIGVLATRVQELL